MKRHKKNKKRHNLSDKQRSIELAKLVKEQLRDHKQSTGHDLDHNQRRSRYYRDYRRILGEQ